MGCSFSKEIHATPVEVVRKSFENARKSFENVKKIQYWGEDAKRKELTKTPEEFTEHHHEFKYWGDTLKPIQINNVYTQSSLFT